MELMAEQRVMKQRQRTNQMMRKFLRDAIKQLGKPATRAAKEAGISGTTLTRFLRDRTDSHTISVATVSKFCAYHGVTNPFEYDARLGAGIVAVGGGIVSGGNVLLGLNAKPSHATVKLPPGVKADEVIALEVMDDTIPPFAPGWIAYVDRREEPMDQLMNKICLVKLEGQESLLVRRLMPGYEPGTFNLLAMAGGLPTTNARVEWASRVAFFEQP